jgi:geranylgeranyl pyrophosphate synthase
MEIDAIYEPIREELQKVEQRLAVVADVDIPVLQKLLGYVVKSGGKRIRPALTLFSGKFYSCDLELLLPVAAAVELLHTATLVHDDVIDSSEERRGKATINKLWGDATAILVGDYLLAKCAELAAETEHIEIMKLLARTVMTISTGELQQEDFSGDKNQGRADYYRWIAAKTASLFSTAAESGAVLADSPEEAVHALRDYGYNLGMAFQVVDDILDFIGDEAELGKPLCSDLSQGVLTLPTIVFLEHYPGDGVVPRALESSAAGDIGLARDKICQSRVIPECFDIAGDFSLRACRALEILPDKSLCSYLTDLARYVVQRRR